MHKRRSKHKVYNLISDKLSHKQVYNDSMTVSNELEESQRQTDQQRPQGHEGGGCVIRNWWVCAVSQENSVLYTPVE